MTLDEISLIAVYSAMAVYAIAFIAYSIDLAKRSAASAPAADELVAGSMATTDATATAANGGSVQTAAKPKAPAKAASVDYGRSPVLRVAVAMTVIAWLLHLSATVLRGIAAERRLPRSVQRSLRPQMAGEETHRLFGGMARDAGVPAQVGVQRLLL